LFTQKSNELNRIAEVNATYNATTTQTSIALINTRSGFEVRNGQTLFLVNVDGTFQSVTVNGNQTLSTSVTINSEVFVTTILAGAMLYESSFTSSSRITQQAGTIVLKATESGGSLNKLALVRLDTSAADGSAILLQANQITLDGQTTFLNSLATNRFTQVASNNIVIESGTAPTQRPNASALVEGDVWIDTANNRRPSVWNGSIWGRGFSVINGGTITTGTVNANVVTITAGTGAVTLDTNGLSLSSGSSLTGEVPRQVSWSNDTFIKGATIGSLKYLAVDAQNFFYVKANNVEFDAIGGGNFNVGDIVSFQGATSGGDQVFKILAIGGASTRSLIIGTETNKATIAYTTNTARTLTIPNVGGNRTFAFIDQAQTLSANQTFTGDVIVPNSTTGTHALNVTTGDARYGRLGAANVFTGAQRFTNASFSLESLPLSDPGIPGRIWNDSGTLKVSP
jgi:hypothetical protein